MKVAIFGATGVVGHAAAELFGASPGWEVVAVSRRTVDLPGVVHVPIDLADQVAASERLHSSAFAGTTHVVFAALQESSDLVGGWRDPAMMAYNLRLFSNAMGPLVAARGSTLQHVSLLQGAKAYGLHVGRTPIPAKERTPRDSHDNFYFLQEDALRSLSDGAAWSWTILRPQVVYGDSIGSPMNLLPALGVYAALERERGHPLSFPGGAPAVQEAVDARLLAQALVWAAGAPDAWGQIFNVTNGDVFSWHDIWPTVCEAFGMEAGDPEPQCLADTMPPRSNEWAEVVDRYHLCSPRGMSDFVGGSWLYADVLLGSRGSRALPALLSTVKIRRAGFQGCLDTEDMFCDWLVRFQARRLIPPR